MSSSITFLALVLVIGQPIPLAQSSSSPDTHASEAGQLPKPAVGLTPGTWRYQSKDDRPANPNAANNHSTFSVTVKDDGSAWTLNGAWEFPEGPVTDSLTLDKRTLVLHKEVFKHFLHTDQQWKPIAVEAALNGNRVTGILKYIRGQDKPFVVSVSGPLFAVSSVDVTVGSLPLAEGYSTSLRYFDIERVALNPQAPDREKLVQVAVLGTERVTVPAGTFDAWKVELTSTDGMSKETAWIAKDSRVPVKTYSVSSWMKDGKTGTASTVTEMVP